MNRIELNESLELQWWRRLSFYWEKEPADDVLSVIVRRPDGSECAILTDSSRLISRFLSNNHTVVVGEQAFPSGERNY